MAKGSRLRLLERKQLHRAARAVDGALDHEILRLFQVVHLDDDVAGDAVEMAPAYWPSFSEMPLARDEPPMRWSPPMSMSK